MTEGGWLTCPACGARIAMPQEEEAEAACPECGAAIAAAEQGAEAELPRDTEAEAAGHTEGGGTQGEEAEAPSEVEALRERLRATAGRRHGSLAKLALLVLTLFLFVAMLKGVDSQTALLTLVPVILIHELGHLAAMKLFGYRDVSVFFIPWFGAAAAGREVRPTQTKRAVVSLMGPLPGILLGFVLLFVAPWQDRPLLLTGIQMLFFLNLFNLLPIMPLDGGHFVEATITSRSALMAILFALASPAALLTLGLWLRAWLIAGLGGFLLLGAGLRIGVVRMARELRHRGLAFESDDPQDLSDDELGAVLDEVRARFRNLRAEAAANLVRGIHRRMIVSRMGVVATLALLLGYAVVIAAGLAGLSLTVFLRAEQEPVYRGRRITEWVERLDDPDVVTRRQAVSVLKTAIRESDLNVANGTAATLDRLGMGAVRAVPVLCEGLKHSSSVVRWRCAKALGNLGLAAAPAVPALTRALNDRDEGVRASSARALAMMGPAAAPAVARLADALADSSPKVRSWAASALGNIGPPARSTLPALERALAVEQDASARQVLQERIGQLRAAGEPEAKPPAKGTGKAR